MSDGINFEVIKLSEDASIAIKNVLRGKDFREVVRWRWLAMTRLSATKTVEASKARSKPKGKVRKRLLKKYRDALALLSEQQSEDPYDSIWDELEAQLIEKHYSIPDRRDFKKAAYTLMRAADWLSEEPVTRGRPSGRSGLGVAIEKAAEDWFDCFGEEPTTSKSSPFVRAIKIIIEDLEGIPQNLETLRSVVRAQNLPDDSIDEMLNEAIKDWKAPQR